MKRMELVLQGIARQAYRLLFVQSLKCVVSISYLQILTQLPASLAGFF
ncbi:hypothetical protein C8D97_102138 [Pleionea mediterranea]|jgi:hypothetical protein|uniref:Uncharacterized protein n=1 Tax=Pleionea mediterranea TaxID=523701 RepID=A0A316FYT9_9GAMM|nr:hypothetical protein C8D97_102138 [Pleionea mediterranea]